MKICIVAEGCYPYVVGGVSSWIHSMIRSFPNVEFVVLAIITNRRQSGKFAYELPENVTEVYESYLDDFDWGKRKKKRNNNQLTEKQYRALRSVLLNEEIEWETLFDLFQNTEISVDSLLMGPEFLQIVKEVYKQQYSQIVFSDFLWTLRSIYLPFFLILKTNLPKANLYHCVATGYAGVLGSMAKWKYGGGLIVSEHGIYTREREEELLKASWVEGTYKNIWIEQFYRMSRLAYKSADVVTSLFARAKNLQAGLGCEPHKQIVTPNGIDVKRFENLSGKSAEEEAYINIGAVLRVTPIKDVKTMIRAFAFAQEKVENIRLWIIGPLDEDEEYAKECFELVETQRIKNIYFTGRVDVTEYLGRMDFTILTSISEGQPLTVLESYAAKKPVITTDVGNCKELIYGEDDSYGTAGILTHIMNVQEIADAIVELARSQTKREKMGQCGYNRVVNRYRIERMKKQYEKLYDEVGWEYGSYLPEEVFEIKE